MRSRSTEGSPEPAAGRGPRRRRWRLGALLRMIARVVLGALLVLGGVTAWQLAGHLHGRIVAVAGDPGTDPLAPEHLADVGLALLQVVRRRVEAPAQAALADAERQMADLRHGLALIEPDPGSAVARDRVRAEVAQALATAGQLLDGRDPNANPADLARAIEAQLAPAWSALRRLGGTDRSVRVVLQDRDLAHARPLVAFNRDLLLALFALALAYLALVTLEAWLARRAARRSGSSEQRFKDFAAVASDWMWETDPEFRLTYVSGGAVPGIELGERIADRSTRGQPGLRQATLAMTARRAFRDLAYSTTTADDACTIRMSGQPVYDERGRFQGYRGVGSDVTAEVRRDEQIRFLAEHDQLTTLLNRATFHERLHAAADAAANGAGAGALLAIDLDGFKEINDIFGHDVGDALLVAVTGRLNEIVSETDTLARLGGDEFAIIQTDRAEPRHAAETMAKWLIDAVAQPFRVAGKEVAIGSSIGIAIFPEDGGTPEEILKAADLALYNAKGDGRGRYRFFDAQIRAALHRRKELEAALGDAIAGDSLDLYLQPQVYLEDGRLSGAEALVRWNCPGVGAVSPGVFIPIAEETGLIVPLGKWVLETACRAAVTWSGPAAGAVIAVNVSPAQFVLSDLVAEVRSILQRTGLAPARLELEVTEGLLMRDERAAIGTLEELRSLGVHIAIDDFGTGYSSLSYLKRFPVDKVKIDKAFVDGLAHDQDDRMIAKAIVMLGQTLSLKTIAEGIETDAQGEFLAALGCDEGQGYLYGRPMPIASFRRQYCDHDAPAAAQAG